MWIFLVVIQKADFLTIEPQDGFDAVVMNPGGLAHSSYVLRDAVEANGERWDPMRVGVTRAFFVTDDPRELSWYLGYRTRRLVLLRCG